MVLPEGLKFLELGWWVSHILAVWLLYAWAYRKGRNDERRAQRAAALAARVEPPAVSPAEPRDSEA